MNNVLHDTNVQQLRNNLKLLIVLGRMSTILTVLLKITTYT